MDDALKIRYETALRELRGDTFEATVAALMQELPYAWLDRYTQMCGDERANALVVTWDTFEYMFDFCSDMPDPPAEREDRLVVAYGRSVKPEKKRPKSRIGGFPGSDERGDRGHFVAHSAGGGVDINLFHQEPQFNRGWSPAGKVYREMEKYCASNPGTFCFSRPIYADLTARPAEIEFGILRTDGTLWVNLFMN